MVSEYAYILKGAFRRRKPPVHLVRDREDGSLVLSVRGRHATITEEEARELRDSIDRLI